MDTEPSWTSPRILSRGFLLMSYVLCFNHFLLGELAYLMYHGIYFHLYPVTAAYTTEGCIFLLPYMYITPSIPQLLGLFQERKIWLVLHIGVGLTAGRILLPQEGKIWHCHRHCNLNSQKIFTQFLERDIWCLGMEGGKKPRLLVLCAEGKEGHGTSTGIPSRAS